MSMGPFSSGDKAVTLPKKALLNGVLLTKKPGILFFHNEKFLVIDSLKVSRRGRRSKLFCGLSAYLLTELFKFNIVWLP